MIPLRSIPGPLLLAVVVLLAGLAPQWLRAPALPRAAGPALAALAALAAGLAMSAATAAGSRREADAALARARAAEAEAERLTKVAARLRHDLRGILSPALLTADRLATSQDPMARRAAEAMISTVERAEQRLRPE